MYNQLVLATLLRPPRCQAVLWMLYLSAQPPPWVLYNLAFGAHARVSVFNFYYGEF